MTFHTYERYDENEYFIKFNKIHPYLSYSNDEHDKKKLKFQIILLENLKNDIITI